MHKALRQAGVDSHMLVADKYTADPTVSGATGITGSQKIRKGLRQTLEYWPLKRYKNKKPGAFSPAITPSNLAAQVEAIDPDIINLHWVAGGFLHPHDLRRFQKSKSQKGKSQKTRHLVWTLRDMWPFTGGCHYSGTCSAYQTNCGACPVLGSSHPNDLSRKTWQRKHSAWKDLEITIAPLSNWLAECARQSQLFAHQRIQVIPNAIDTDKYRPIDKGTARSLLNLPQHKKLILFGALSPTADPRKGFTHLRAALQHLSTQPHTSDYEAVIFGTSKPAKPLDLRLPTTFLGRLTDDTLLAMAYAAADVMVMPSIQDNFAKTTIEAMACGTPLVAFNATGAKDVIVHKQNGYATDCFDNTDLAAGITWVLSDQERWQNLSKFARQTVENNFSLTHQANQYQQLYRALMKESS